MASRLLRQPLSVSPRPLQQAGPISPRSAGQVRPASTAMGGTGLLFFGYLLLVFLEYTGLPNVVPVMKVTRFTTILAWALFLSILVKVGPRAFSEYLQSKLLTAFVLFTMLAVPFAYVQSSAFEAFRTHLDYLGLFIVTLYLVDRPNRLKLLALTYAGVIGVLVVRNFDKLTAATRQGGFQAAYFLGDGNDFAWGLNVLLPIVLFVAIDRNRLSVRLASLMAVLAATFGIIGTQSRGATIALGAGLLYYWVFVARRKVLGLLAVLVMAVAVLSYAPAEYFERIEAMSSFEQDNSAMGRLQVWGAAIKMSLDHPLGVGPGNFSSAYGRFYRPDAGDSLMVWGQGRWLSAHSVYFRVLGEYGVGGLALIVFLIVVNIGRNAQTRQVIRDAGGVEGVPDFLPGLLNMSLISYSVAAVFLGGLTYPHLYVLTALTVGTSRRVTAGIAALPMTTQAPKAPAIHLAPSSESAVSRRLTLGAPLRHGRSGAKA